MKQGITATMAFARKFGVKGVGMLLLRLLLTGTFGVISGMVFSSAVGVWVAFSIGLAVNWGKKYAIGINAILSAALLAYIGYLRYVNSILHQNFALCTATGWPGVFVILGLSAWAMALYHVVELVRRDFKAVFSRNGWRRQKRYILSFVLMLYMLSLEFLPTSVSPTTGHLFPGEIMIISFSFWLVINGVAYFLRFFKEGIIEMGHIPHT